ncbi:MAG: hypothetical protein RIS36_443 [Pseudomonadota bacterium]|jgi:hypothetical protein
MLVPNMLTTRRRCGSHSRHGQRNVTLRYFSWTRVRTGAFGVSPVIVLLLAGTKKVRGDILHLTIDVIRPLPTRSERCYYLTVGSLMSLAPSNDNPPIAKQPR